MFSFSSYFLHISVLGGSSLLPPGKLSSSPDGSQEVTHSSEVKLLFKALVFITPYLLFVP